MSSHTWAQRRQTYWIGWAANNWKLRTRMRIRVTQMRTIKMTWQSRASALQHFEHEYSWIFMRHTRIPHITNLNEQNNNRKLWNTILLNRWTALQTIQHNCFDKHWPENCKCITGHVLLYKRIITIVVIENERNNNSHTCGCEHNVHQ